MKRYKFSLESINSNVLKVLELCVFILIFIAVFFVIKYINTPILKDAEEIVSTKYLELPSGKYAGDATLDAITGKGSFYFDTGEIYKGSFINDSLSGDGKFTYTQGSYEGSFLNSKRDGQGTFVWKDGASYTGAWRADHLNGKGVLKRGPSVFDGYFNEDVFYSGLITITTNNAVYTISMIDGTLGDRVNIKFASGITYLGDFKNNTISGTGTMVYPNVGKYEGDFADGKRNGVGTFTWDDGGYYAGSWSNDLMNGTGQYIFKSGEFISGIFDNGKLNGTYTFHNKNGDYTTTWVNNKNTKVAR